MITLFLLAAATTQGRGGPPAVFRTEVPASDLDVIAGAPTDHSVKLSLRAKVDTSFRLSVAEGKTITGNLAAGAPKSVQIDDLRATTTYNYKVEASGAQVQGKFTTARQPGSPFVFAVQADSHLDGNSDPAVYANTLQNEAADKPDFLVDLGDTFMVDKYRDYRDSLKQYQAQRYWFSRIGSQASVFLCLGNHDGETGWVMKGETGLSDWSRSQRQLYFPTVEQNGFYTGAPTKGLYYSWTWGDALFVVLDPFVATVRKPRDDEEGWNWTLGKTQYDWLASTLQTSRAKYKFVFIHHLVGGSGKEARGGTEVSDRFEWGADNTLASNRPGWSKSVHELLRQNNVSVVFHGHDHLYMRQIRDGVTYLEVPQPSEARGDNTSSASEYGYTTGDLFGGSGHIRVSVSPEAARLEYVKSRPSSTRNGQIVHSFSVKPNQN